MIFRKSLFWDSTKTNIFYYTKSRYYSYRSIAIKIQSVTIKHTNHQLGTTDDHYLSSTTHCPSAYCFLCGWTYCFLYDCPDDIPYDFLGDHLDVCFDDSQLWTLLRRLALLDNDVAGSVLPWDLE